MSNGMFIPANGVKISENTITPSGLSASYGCKEISTHKSTVSERSRNVVFFAQILVHFPVPSSLSHHPDGRSFALARRFDRAHHERVSRRCFHHREEIADVLFVCLASPSSSSTTTTTRRGARTTRSFPSSSFNGNSGIRTNTPQRISVFRKSTLGTRFFTEQPARFDPCVALEKVVVSQRSVSESSLRKKARRCVVSVDKSGKRKSIVSLFPPCI